ncbi:hypothetical protein DFH27DRAFT_615602 [Peziza echinospora]|nr:hypothetical protein DFH27DRAFT_615602 [Peziza echinospora]
MHAVLGTFLTPPIPPAAAGSACVNKPPLFLHPSQPPPPPPPPPPPWTHCSQAHHAPAFHITRTGRRQSIRILHKATPFAALALYPAVIIAMCRERLIDNITLALGLPSTPAFLHMSVSAPGLPVPIQISPAQLLEMLDDLAIAGVAQFVHSQIAVIVTYHEPAGSSTSTPLSPSPSPPPQAPATPVHTTTTITTTTSTTTAAPVPTVLPIDCHLFATNYPNFAKPVNLPGRIHQILMFPLPPPAGSAATTTTTYTAICNWVQETLLHQLWGIKYAGPGAQCDLDSIHYEGDDDVDYGGTMQIESKRKHRPMEGTTTWPRMMITSVKMKRMLSDGMDVVDMGEEVAVGEEGNRRRRTGPNVECMVHVELGEVGQEMGDLR